MGLKDYGLKLGKEGIVMAGVRPGKPRYLSEVEIVTHLRDNYKKSYIEIEKILPSLYSEAAEEPIDMAAELVKVVESLDIFKNFYVTRNKDSNEPIVVYQKGTDKYPVCTLDIFTAEVAYNTLNT